MRSQSHFLIFGLAIALAFSGFAAQAAERYPDRPVRMVVAYPPGGTNDILARAVAQRLTGVWHQQFIVDNRPGGGANIGPDLVAHATPDGYTLLVGASSHAINASLYSHLSYDPVADFAAVALLATVPSCLVVNPSLPVRSVKDLIALAKKRPGELNMASGGNGTSLHLEGEMFKAMTGVRMTHVPYKGAPPALLDLIAGNADLMFVAVPAVISYIKAGRLKVLAVTSTKRSAALPHVPTLDEAGVRGYQSAGFYGVFAPARTPASVVQTLNTTINRELKTPEMSSQLAAQGAEAAVMTPEEFESYFKSEVAKWRRVIKASGAKVD
jgi:tripartite-type tricarboxylate transporter receptor subunit TctC